MSRKSEEKGQQQVPDDTGWWREKGQPEGHQVE
jgi:hypothetical protein